MRGEYRWLSAPAVGSGNDKRLELSTDLKTDFWRRTFYGFTRDNGHAYLRKVSGDFAASVFVRGQYEQLYDQAGLFLRLAETHWIKAGSSLPIPNAAGRTVCPSRIGSAMRT